MTRTTTITFSFVLLHTFFVSGWVCLSRCNRARHIPSATAGALAHGFKQTKQNSWVQLSPGHVMCLHLPRCSIRMLHTGTLECWAPLTRRVLSVCNTLAPFYAYQRHHSRSCHNLSDYRCSIPDSNANKNKTQYLHDPQCKPGNRFDCSRRRACGYTTYDSLATAVLRSRSYRKNCWTSSFQSVSFRRRLDRRRDEQRRNPARSCTSVQDNRIDNLPDLAHRSGS